MPYGDTDMDQHWLRQWLGAVRHHAITWINVDLSLMRFCVIHSSNIQQVPKLLFCVNSFKIILLILLPHPPGVNELNVGSGYKLPHPPTGTPTPTPSPPPEMTTPLVLALDQNVYLWLPLVVVLMFTAAMVTLVLIGRRGDHPEGYQNTSEGTFDRLFVML